MRCSERDGKGNEHEHPSKYMNVNIPTVWINWEHKLGKSRSSQGFSCCSKHSTVQLSTPRNDLQCGFPGEAGLEGHTPVIRRKFLRPRIQVEFSDGK